MAGVMMNRWWLSLLALLGTVVAFGAWMATPTDAPVLASAPELVQQQVQAEQAVQASAPPATGPVNEKPAYVSELEWQVLKGVAAQKANPEQELRRLVANLHFSKQLEQWRQLAGKPDIAQRRALAQALLADIPARVTDAELDDAGARQLQKELLADLYSDPAERVSREQVEAARLPATALQVQP
ncbi:MAG TPA: hypothetical protein VF050_04970 [Moraxellaceae bacterium]